MTPEITLGILLFIGFCIPVIKSIWQVYSVRDQLDSAIKENSHRLDLVEQKGEHLIDQQTLAINGIREMVQHVRERSQREEDSLARRVADLERFLEKTTNFSPRSQ